MHSGTLHDLDVDVAKRVALEVEDRGVLNLQLGERALDSLFIHLLVILVNVITLLIDEVTVKLNSQRRGVRE